MFILLIIKQNDYHVTLVKAFKLCIYMCSLHTASIFKSKHGGIFDNHL